ncbi:hypothetical protein K438DRAFT_1771835 [Mycena galopus ATCC 62051]|nr:hypothetical protein K438DRAFT_1771835 [Mycena galopus ATCC 62051]
MLPALSSLPVLQPAGTNWSKLTMNHAGDHVVPSGHRLNDIKMCRDLQIQFLALADVNSISESLGSEARHAPRQVKSIYVGIIDTSGCSAAKRPRILSLNLTASQRQSIIW